MSPSRSESDVQSWAERLGGVLEEAVPHLFPKVISFAASLFARHAEC